MLPHLEKKKTREEALEIWNKKLNFVVSNPKWDKIIEFFKYLSGYKHAESGVGSFLDNLSFGVIEKLIIS
jgi:hypothetical protein